jgi:tetratricopeptide (TPR) repeat protein
VAFRGLALPIFEDLGDLKGQATVLNNLGIESYYEGDWPRALDVYERSRDLFRRIGDVTNVAMTTNNIGEIRSDQGHLEEAERLFGDVRDAVDAAGQRLLSAVSRLNLGRAAARAGRFEDAKDLIAEAADAFDEIHAASFGLEARVRLAETAVLEGDHDFALRETELAELTSEANAPPALLALIHRVRGYAHLQARRPEEAANEFELSLAAARSGDALYEVALSFQARASLHGGGPDLAEAESLFESLQVVRTPPIPL